MTLAEHVQTTISQLELEPQDAAIAALAVDLAQRIDVEKSNRTVAELSAKLLAALHAMNATPEARKQKNGGERVVIEGKLAEQRALRSAGTSR